MMRLILCIGDQPETGGKIEPYIGPNLLFWGHQAAMIGAHVHCNACNSSGPIAKAGGPRRPRHHGVEVAHDGDIVLCKCPRPPRMIATMQSRASNDDMIESMGDVSEQGTELSMTAPSRSIFDQQFTLLDRATQKPLGRVAYVITRPSGETLHSTERDASATAKARMLLGKQLLMNMGFIKAPIRTSARVYNKGDVENGRRIEISFEPQCPNRCCNAPTRNPTEQ